MISCRILWYLILSLSIFLKHVIQINNVELCIVFVNFRKWCHCPVLQVILSRQFLSQIQSSPLLSCHQSHRVIVQNSWNLCFCFIRFFEGFFYVKLLSNYCYKHETINRTIFMTAEFQVLPWCFCVSEIEIIYYMLLHVKSCSFNN